MKTNHRLFLAGCLVALVVPVSAAPLPPDAPLVVDGPFKVDAGDFEGYLLRAPENRRGEIRASYDRVANVVDNVFVARVLAAKARAAGLDQDPAIQRRLAQVQEALLADMYVQKELRDAPVGDLEQRARELYKADQSKYVRPEHVHIQQILIGLSGRTREMAEQRVRQVYEEAKSGKEDFLALAKRYSEDPEIKRNGGDVGYFAKPSYYPPIARAFETMKTKGEISEPIETERGFYIIRFMDRQKEVPVKFEDVRQKLIEAEKEKLQQKHLQQIIEDVRASKTAVLHRENIEALVIPVEDLTAKLKAASEAAARERR